MRLATTALGRLAACALSVAHAELVEDVAHGYADNNGVKIHYASIGQGQLVIMIHGFPTAQQIIAGPPKRPANST